MILKQRTIDIGAIHIWYLFTNEIHDLELIDSYFEIISNDEFEKINKYIFDKDRHSCLLTRALIRYVLSRYVNKKPYQWEFSINDYGKPAIKNIPENQLFKFNISHTDGLIALALTTTGDIGIDIENLERNKTKNKSENKPETKIDNISIAKRFFSQKEAVIIKNAAQNTKMELFLDFWTLKEAYIKARGMGLSIPLDKFYFTITDNNIDIGFDSEINDIPENWQFFKLNLDNKYKMSIAINDTQQSSCQLQFFRCVPFKYEYRQSHK